MSNLEWNPLFLPRRRLPSSGLRWPCRDRAVSSALPVTVRVIYDPLFLRYIWVNYSNGGRASAARFAARRRKTAPSSLSAPLSLFLSLFFSCPCCLPRDQGDPRSTASITTALAFDVSSKLAFSATFHASFTLVSQMADPGAMDSLEQGGEQVSRGTRCSERRLSALE